VVSFCPPQNKHIGVWSLTLNICGTQKSFVFSHVSFLKLGAMVGRVARSPLEKSTWCVCGVDVWHVELTRLLACLPLALQNKSDSQGWI
jgi:hypothetical protein